MKKIINILLVIACILMSVEVAFAQSNILNKANDYFQQAEYAKSIEFYKKILKKNDTDKVALEQIAHAYRLMGQFAEAGHWYQKAMVFNSNNPLLKFHYAQTLMTNGKYAEAEKYFEEYAQKVPYDSRGKKFAESCRNIKSFEQDSYMYQLQKLKLNSSREELFPSFYKDGVVFHVTEGHNNASYFSQRNGNQLGMPNGLAIIPSNFQLEGALSFDRNSNKVYLSRNTSIENNTQSVSFGIFEAELVGNQLANIRPLSFNNAYYSISSPSISADGKTLYFSSDMPGGFGGQDLYSSTFQNGNWSKPRNLGSSINTEGDENYPYVHQNGTLYFASNGLGGFGSFDVFGAVHTNANKWETKNVGAPINSSSDDFGLILTNDFQTGYFSSNRKGGQGKHDMYQININEAKAAEMLARASDASSLNTFQTNYSKSKHNKEKTAKEYEMTSILKYKLKGNLKLVLVGIVLNKETKEPIEGAEVILEDLVSSDKQQFTTQKDGNFYFKLEAERQYSLFKIGRDGLAEAPVSISTVNKDETEILHAVLESTSSTFDESEDRTLVDVFEMNESPPTKVSSTYSNGPYSDSQIVFKIQIGAFRQKLDANSDFLGKIRGEVDTEKTRSGLIRYMMGNFNDFGDAETFRIQLLRQGYTKSFVAAYINGVRLDMPVEEVLQRY